MEYHDRVLVFGVQCRVRASQPASRCFSPTRGLDEPKRQGLQAKRARAVVAAGHGSPMRSRRRRIARSAGGNPVPSAHARSAGVLAGHASSSQGDGRA